MKNLYFAPINLYGNIAYRRLILNHGADYVFTELIMCEKIDKYFILNKLEGVDEKTIVQIGVNSKEQISEILKLIKLKSKEVNLNLGCPHSSFKKRKICSGILYDILFLQEITKTFSKLCAKHKKIPSVKIRMGVNPEKIEIEEYLKILEENKIFKIYIHARTLRHPYTKPVNKEVLFGLKDKFPNLELIYNGDIDSYEKYKQVEPYFDGVMIGRAALSNPLIFEQIKNKEKNEKITKYDPLVNDPNIIHKGGRLFFTEKKKKVIEEFEKISSELNINKNLVNANLKYLNKGVKKLIKFI